ncbi:MAG: TolC family protein [Bdellovibrionaceae bacterium]|nr:TolC family protein [Pseudobdellovibrionaceae bacterium]
MKYLFLLTFFLWNDLIFAQTLSFEDVWKQIDSQSLAQQSAELQVQSLQESQQRASRHWLPKVYVDMKSYRTNDPGASFFGVIEQRALSNADFNAAQINNPAAATYSRGAVGLDFSLYEGGMKSNQVDMLKKSVQAQQEFSNQTKIDQYAQVGYLYGGIGVLQKTQLRLTALKTEVDNLLKKYQLGSRSNPVGYSGLLGMKSLAHRVTGLMTATQSQTSAYYNSLREFGVSQTNWYPETVSSQQFIDKYLFANIVPSEEQSSYKVDSLKMHARATEFAAKMERARFLPQVGAFAEGYMFKGSRDTANGYMAGLYLRWNLFNSTDYGAYKEARLRAQAMERGSQAEAQRERAERKGVVQSLQALKENLDLMTDSDKLLDEQVKTTRTLFKNGSINALQMAEVLNRRADLIAQLNDIELKLLESASKALSTKKIDTKLLAQENGEQHGK